MKFLISEKLSQHKYKTPEGYLVCIDAILARTGKQSYRRSEVFADGDDEIIEIDRLPEEVFSPQTLASFENKPITVEHPDEDVNSENYKEYAVGFVRDVHRGVVDGQEVILGTLVITDAQTIEEIENGEHTDLSCGYDCDIVDEANPQQRNIRGNHVALCAEGRAGNARIVDSNKVKDEYQLNTSSLEKIISQAKNKFEADVAYNAVRTARKQNSISEKDYYILLNKAIEKQVMLDDSIKDYRNDPSGDLGKLVKTIEDLAKTGKYKKETLLNMFDNGTEDILNGIEPSIKSSYQSKIEIARKDLTNKIHDNQCKDDKDTKVVFVNDRTKIVQVGTQGRTYAQKVGSSWYIMRQGQTLFRADNENDAYNHVRAAADINDSIKDVNPREGETKEEFISRFMSETKEEYPDEKQRFAVANSYWEKKDMKDSYYKIVKEVTSGDIGIFSDAPSQWRYEVKSIKPLDDNNYVITAYELVNGKKVSFTPKQFVSNGKSKVLIVDSKGENMKDEKGNTYFIFKYSYVDGNLERIGFYSSDSSNFETAKQELEDWCKSRSQFPYKIISYKTEVEDSSCKDVKDSYYSEKEKQDKVFVRNAIEEMERYIKNWNFLTNEQKREIQCSQNELRERVKELRESLNDSQSCKDELVNGFAKKINIDGNIFYLDENSIDGNIAEYRGNGGRKVISKNESIKFEVKDSKMKDSYVQIFSGWDTFKGESHLKSLANKYGLSVEYLGSWTSYDSYHKNFREKGWEIKGPKDKVTEFAKEYVNYSNDPWKKIDVRDNSIHDSVLTPADKQMIDDVISTVKIKTLSNILDALNEQIPGFVGSYGQCVIEYINSKGIKDSKMYEIKWKSGKDSYKSTLSGKGLNDAINKFKDSLKSRGLKSGSIEIKSIKFNDSIVELNSKLDKVITKDLDKHMKSITLAKVTKDSKVKDAEMYVILSHDGTKYISWDGDWTTDKNEIHVFKTKRDAIDYAADIGLYAFKVKVMII